MSKKSKRSSLLKQLWNKSQTVYLAYSQAISAAVLAAIPVINSFLTSPEVNKFLGTLTVPWYVYTGIALFGVLTYLAHGHGGDA